MPGSGAAMHLTVENGLARQRQEVIGADKVMLGSAYPFHIGEPDPDQSKFGVWTECHGPGEKSPRHGGKVVW